MARAALRLNVRELAVMASVSTMTITRFETGRTKAQPAKRRKLRAALEAAGVVFIEADAAAKPGRAPGCAILAATEPSGEISEPPDEATSPTVTLAPEQCRMARAALQIGVRDLARMAGLSAMTVSRFETGQTEGQAKTLRKLQAALEAAGIEFIPANGGGAGVRLKE